MAYAYIENGIVKQTLRVDPHALFAPGYASQFVEAPDDVQVGHTYADGVFTAPPAPALTVPQSVSMRQARLALLAAGLLGAVETAITQAGAAATIEWEYATSVDRTYGLVPAMATALGLTGEQLDALFVAAAAL